MPFKSRRQMKFLFARHPKIARRWKKKYGVPKDLPQKVGSLRKRRKTTGRATRVLMKRSRRRMRYSVLKK